MRKSALFLLLFLFSATPLFAQTQGQGGLGNQPGSPDLNQPGNQSPTSPDFGGQGGAVPCPPGSTAPDLNQGGRGGLGQPNLDNAVPNDRNPQTPGTLQPNSPGSVPPNPQGSVPPNPQGSIPNMGDQGGGLNQPGLGSGNQFGTTHCPPTGGDQGGLSQGGHDVPGSNRQTPPPLLPPSGGVQ